MVDNPFLPDVVKGIAKVAETSSYKFVIAMGNSTAAIESGHIETMIDFSLDGVILIAPRLPGDTLERYARQIPMVLE
ncbi:hypothetical protein PX860_25300 (plasmid) [Agrobacterium leguminum]|uniref:hypothetical protein n=1 Tax=Agrobacterium leguminum TaxID=2792015 RepID=UPI002729CA29|nr:hypothetical protein [Agrobacterium leguminum]WLE00633.1 hypothetical protein PX860_25300 [Agrobacterium leguminum]